ncbi:MAG: helix-turn-helix domain-containing protein, partial [Candidatus Omnitrophica bacterium]|nr:helix-turn-helix domain-containing protein [Candidatus Omnitrophota bacterium]
MANPDQTNKISMASIGERLREAREKKALTIEQAQKQTRIHSTVLAALEDGRCDNILAPNYVKSFLREYSNYLGLNSKELLNAYTAIHPEPN